MRSRPRLRRRSSSRGSLAVRAIWLRRAGGRHRRAAPERCCDVRPRAPRPGDSATNLLPTPAASRATTHSLRPLDSCGLPRCNTATIDHCHRAPGRARRPSCVRGSTAVRGGDSARELAHRGALVTSSSASGSARAGSRVTARGAPARRRFSPPDSGREAGRAVPPPSRSSSSRARAARSSSGRAPARSARCLGVRCGNSASYAGPSQPSLLGGQCAAVDATTNRPRAARTPRSARR